MSIAMQNEIDALRKRVEELERLVSQSALQPPPAVHNVRQDVLSLKRKNG